MMGWYYGNNMMGSGFGLWAFLVWLVILIDLVLLGIWLWKQVKKIR